MRWLSVGVCLLAGSLALGQEPAVTIPAEVKAKPGRLVQIEATTTGKVVRWKCASEDADCIAIREDGRRAVFSSPFPGRYLVFAWTAKGDLPSEASVCVVVVEGKAPVPPMPPIPPDPPAPPVPPAPPSQVWIVVVEETGQAAANRGRFFNDADLWSYVKTKGWTHRIVDKDVKDASGKVPEDMVPYLRRSEGKALPQIYVVDQDGKVRHEGRLPGTPAELLTILKRIGG